MRAYHSGGHWKAAQAAAGREATVSELQFRADPRREDASIVVVFDDSAITVSLIELRCGVAALLQSGTSHLVVDISRLDRLSSSTVAALLWAQRMCRARGGTVVLRGVTRRGHRTLRRTQLLRIFDVEGAAALPDAHSRIAG